MRLFRMSGNGYCIPKKYMIIDESNDVVTTYSLLSGNDDKVIDIKCPSGSVIMIKGILQLFKDETREDAHQFVLRFASKDNIEIDIKTKISIMLVCPFEEEKLVYRDFYGQFSPLNNDKTTKEYNEFFRLRESVAIYEGCILRICVKKPNVDIDYKHVLLSIGSDVLEVNQLRSY